MSFNEVRAKQIAQLSKVVSIVRADMSHLPPREYWSRLQEQVKAEAAEMPAEQE